MGFVGSVPHEKSDRYVWVAFVHASGRHADVDVWLVLPVAAFDGANAIGVRHVGSPAFESTGLPLEYRINRPVTERLYRVLPVQDPAGRLHGFGLYPWLG